MKIVILFATAAAAALISGAALAQPSTQPAQSAPVAATGPAVSTSLTTADRSTGATLTVTTFTNGPVPDTQENRARYGQPMSNAGKRTPAKGN
jgi:hypothetical protein